MAFHEWGSVRRSYDINAGVGWRLPANRDDDDDDDGGDGGDGGDDGDGDSDGDGDGVRWLEP